MIVGTEVEKGNKPVELLKVIDYGHNFNATQVTTLPCSVPREKFLSTSSCDSQEEGHINSCAIFRFQMSSIIQIVKKLL